MIFVVVEPTLASNMSVVEEIRRTLNEEDRASVLKAQDGEAALKRLESAGNAAAQKAERILEESGLSDILQEIDRELLQDHDFHGIVYSPKMGRITLAWGWGITSEDGKLKVVGPAGAHEYKYISVEIGVHDETLMIGRGQVDSSDPSFVVLQKPEWKNKATLERAVAQSYLKPNSSSYDPGEHVV